MSKVITLLTVCMILAVLRAALITVLLALILAAFVSFIARPRGTLVLLASIGLLGLASAQPIACIVTVGVVAVALIVAGAWPGRRKQLRLIDRQQKP